MKKVLVVLIAISIAVLAVFFITGDKKGKIEKSSDFEACASGFLDEKVSFLQENGLEILIEGKSLKTFGYQMILEDDMKMYASESFLEDIMGCSVNVYKNGKVVIYRASTSLEFKSDDVRYQNGEVYVPLNDYAGLLGYELEYSFTQNTVNFVNTDEGNNLPVSYDMRKIDRVTPVRDQGKWGTCWAFASLGALETSTMPGEENIYSVDHMSKNNGYTLDISEGGEHTMSIAYMAAWEGPVYEKDDPYGDEVTDDTLEAVKHLEEAIIIKSRDDTKVKSAIYKYGGVETSIYLEMSYGSSMSKYYNSETSSYFYDGAEEPNHDVVIVGWDDEYSKENFSLQPSSDGAYICKNSWGEEFGDNGYFYISYEDVNICQESIVYSRLGSATNYDNIYQSDRLGWVGQMGFSEESAYLANVYTAKGDENLEAVSFYATGDNTSFTVFVVEDYKDETSLNKGRQEVGKGETRYAGYYTVDLQREIELTKGQKYAVIISVNTPGSEKPIAIECDAGERTSSLDLSDGEGYMSLYGEVWHRAEESNANICLKAFTKNR